MKRPLIALALLTAWLVLDAATALAAPCLIVTLTGTHGGPQQPFNGLASAGTLVRYGDDANSCGIVKMQFDAGRGTTMRLSQIGVGTCRTTRICDPRLNSCFPPPFGLVPIPLPVAVSRSLP